MSSSSKIHYSLEQIRATLTGPLLLDTSAIIEASISEKFLDFLITLKNQGHNLVTIPEVLLEFYKTAKETQQFRKRKQFIIDASISILRPRNNLYGTQELENFMRVYYHDATNPSITDYRLCLEIFENNDLCLLSGNHKDIPTSIFDRRDFIITDNGSAVHTEAIYTFSGSNYKAREKQIIS